MACEENRSEKWKDIQRVLSTASPFSHEEFEESPEVVFASTDLDVFYAFNLVSSQALLKILPVFTHLPTIRGAG